MADPGEAAHVSSVLILEPHNDDCALFCAFTALREQAHIVTCLRSFRQAQAGVMYFEREWESAEAAGELGCTWEQWSIPDTKPDEMMRAELADALRPELDRVDWQHVYAPAPIDGGHEHHNAVGEVAAELVGADRLTFYTTYRRGEGRTVGRPVTVDDPTWIAAKLRALACFPSQHANAGTRPWFMCELTEWYA